MKPIACQQRDNVPSSERPAWVPIILLPAWESKVDNEGSHAIGRHPATAVVVEFDSTQLESSLADTGLANVVARAVEVLGSRQRALAWLRTPLTGLGGRTLLAAMAEAEGRQQVEDILGRIEHGVFG